MVLSSANFGLGFSLHYYCDLAGCREDQGKHYFPVLLKPAKYNIEGCVHDDIDIKELPKPSHERYHQNLCYLLTSPSESQYWI